MALAEKWFLIWEEVTHTLKTQLILTVETREALMGMGPRGVRIGRGQL